MLYYFQVGKQYKRRDVYKTIDISEDTKGGNWDTGYNQYKGDWFIFCNVGVAGRTGHNYNNIFMGGELIWFGKTNSRLHHPSIQSMITPSVSVYIFIRENNADPFTYLGIGKAISIEDSKPVKVVWGFTENYEASQR